ncbi:MAG: carbohydrate ABC transporter permease [Eubacteriales bacterium]
MKKIIKKLNLKAEVFPIICWTILFLWCLIFLVMLGWAFVASFSTNREFYLNPGGIPKTWKFSNYITAIQNIHTPIRVAGGGTREVYLPEMILNSLLYAVGAPFFAVLTAAIASYVVAKYSRFKWVAGIFAIVIFTTYVPLSPSLAANLTLLKSLHLYDSMIGMWIWSSGAFGSMFLLYYANFKGVSWTYAEAAFIDGASHFKVFTRVMLPLTSNVFGALFLTTFINIWNDYMTPMIYMPSYPTVSFAAWKIQYSTETAFAIVPIRLAGLVLVILPVLILFIATKEKLMNSLAVGGIKG